jgi:Fe-S-cluster containining protein
MNRSRSSKFKDYRKFLDRIDSLTDKIKKFYSNYINCQAGCFDCCKQIFSITPVEAFFIIENVSNLYEIFNYNYGDNCPFLQDDGRCGIYEYRPVTCRLQGYPMLIEYDGREVLTYCEKNFTAIDDSFTFKGELVLDAYKTAAILFAINEKFTKSTKPLERIKMDEILKLYEK